VGGDYKKKKKYYQLLHRSNTIAQNSLLVKQGGKKSVLKIGAGEIF